MSDNYLWDRSGEPDPEVQRLETVLSKLRGPARELALPEEMALEKPRRRWWFWPRLGAWPQFAAATAALAVVAVGIWLAAPATGPGWEVVADEGTPRVGRRALGASGGRLRRGQWLETDSRSRATIQVGTIGRVQVEPNSRLRLLETRSNDHRLSLLYGTIIARISAPPRIFYVETPSATAVDLGCTYVLTVDKNGAGLLRVTYGWVGFETNGRESFIPLGAACATRVGIGPGTPYMEDAPAALVAALTKLDFERLSPEARAAELRVVLAEARKKDALTLWHLLPRVDGELRVQVYERLNEFVPLPAGADREGVLSGNRLMLDKWWDELGHGRTSWWRTWKAGPPPAK